MTVLQIIPALPAAQVFIEEAKAYRGVVALALVAEGGGFRVTPVLGDGRLLDPSIDYSFV